MQNRATGSTTHRRSRHIADQNTSKSHQYQQSVLKTKLGGSSKGHISFTCRKFKKASSTKGTPVIQPRHTPAISDEQESMASSSIPSSKTVKKTNFKWPKGMEIKLCELLLLQKTLGRRTQNGWKGTTFQECAMEINRLFGTKITLNHVKHMIKGLKDHYTGFKRLFSQSGFRWDDGTKHVTVDDHVWNQVLEVSVGDFDPMC